MTKTKFNTLLATTAVLALAACGGSSTNNGAASYTNIASEGQRLIIKHQNEDFTSVSNMPTGVTTYTGVGAFTTSNETFRKILENPKVISTATIRVDFDNNTISGQLTNFENPTGGKALGFVNLENGAINQNGFIATMNGKLNIAESDLFVSGEVTAGFLGQNAKALAGGITGTFDSEPVWGAIIAER